MNKAKYWRYLKEIVSYHLPMLLKVEWVRRHPNAYSKVHFKPVTAALNITDRCNMHCVMCNSWQNTAPDDLKTEGWKDVLRQLKEQGVKVVGFIGGEPLLRRDVADLIAYATSIGLRTSLTTSGYLLDEGRAQALVKAGVGSVTISIDGVGEQYESIRGRDYGRVERACEILGKLKKEKGLYVIISFTLMKPTLEHFDAVKALSERLDIPLNICLLDYSPYLFQVEENTKSFWIREGDMPRLRKIQESLVKAKESSEGRVLHPYVDIDFFPKYFQDPLQAKIPCAVSQHRVLIDSHGSVYGGCWSMGSYGSLCKQSLAEIIASKAYQEAHRKMFFKECPGCSCGYPITLRYSLPNQIKEGLFRVSKRMRDTIWS